MKKTSKGKPTGKAKSVKTSVKAGASPAGRVPSRHGAIRGRNPGSFLLK